jgi:hypothetical protein
MRVTKASEDLRTKFAKEHGAQRRMAEAAGIGQPRLCLIAKGRLFPRADEGNAIEEAGGPPVKWWSLPSDRTAKRRRQAAEKKVA